MNTSLDRFADFDTRARWTGTGPLRFCTVEFISRSFPAVWGLDDPRIPAVELQHRDGELVVTKVRNVEDGAYLDAKGRWLRWTDFADEARRLAREALVAAD